jgi:hypothetical protein
MFAAGAAIGSAVTWKILKTKYDRLIQEEIDSVKEAFSDRFDSAVESDDEENEDEDEDEDEESTGPSRKINWSELEDIIDEDEDEDEDEEFTEAEKIEYEELASTYTGEKGGVEDMLFKPPYVISPYDFGELDDYSQIELTYYLDGILEDDEYHIVTDADDLIGPDALNTFGEYEDDSVFVRNERLRTDFQILKDYRTYDEARSVGPVQVDN